MLYLSYTFILKIYNRDMKRLLLIPTSIITGLIPVITLVGCNQEEKPYPIEDGPFEQDQGQDVNALAGFAIEFHLRLKDEYSGLILKSPTLSIVSGRQDIITNVLTPVVDGTDVLIQIEINERIFPNETFSFNLVFNENLWTQTIGVFNVTYFSNPVPWRYFETDETNTILKGLTREATSDLHVFDRYDTINIPDQIVEIADNGLQNPVLDNTISFVNFSQQSQCTTIGYNFLQNCAKLHQVNLPPNLKTIDNYFLAMSGIDTEVKLPTSVEEIGQGFMSGCINYDQPFTIPSKIETLSAYFFGGCTNFNHPINIPSTVENIDYGFLINCRHFNQDLVLPNSLEVINIASFLGNVDDMTSTITVNCDVSTVIRQGGYVLVCDNPNADCIQTGITIAGTYGGEFKAMYPDLTGPEQYRHLLLL